MMILRRIIFAAAGVALMHVGALAQPGKIYHVGLVSVGTPGVLILGPSVAPRDRLHPQADRSEQPR